MTLPRSTYCQQPDGPADDPAVIEILDITSTCHGYGYRRVTAELRHRGQRENAKKVRRILAENGLNPLQTLALADLSDADLFEANLERAALFDANISGAQLCGVTGLAQRELDEASTESTAQPPKLQGLRCAAPGRELTWNGAG